MVLGDEIESAGGSYAATVISSVALRPNMVRVSRNIVPVASASGVKISTRSTPRIKSGQRTTSVTVA